MRSLIILLFIGHFAFGQTSDFNMKIYVDEDENAIRLLGDNSEYFPISVSLQIDLKGTKLENPLEDYYVLQPNSSGTLLATIPKPSNRSWSYRFAYNYSMGNALAIHDDQYAYQLPFPQGQSYRLTQGYNGRSTHQGLNALDFTMPEGDTITAAREGIVVRIKEDSNRGCPSSNCANDGNYVTILHSDGTMADYVHLQKNGVLVELGDIIEKGQVIALNGATGWASGAHLHFVVYSTGEHAQESIQVRFETAPGRIEFLEENTTYSAFQ